MENLNIQVDSLGFKNIRAKQKGGMFITFLGKGNIIRLIQTHCKIVLLLNSMDSSDPSYSLCT